jgi:hypothetical protein
VKRLTTARTVYDRTGAGMPLRNFDVHIDHVDRHEYEYGHHEMPHGHPQNYNYANHPNTAEHQHEHNGAPLISPDHRAPRGRGTHRDDDEEEFYEPATHMDGHGALHQPVPSRAPARPPQSGYSQPAPVRSVAPVAPLTRTFVVDADEVMTPATGGSSRRVFDSVPALQPTAVPTQEEWDDMVDEAEHRAGDDAYGDGEDEQAGSEGSVTQRELEEEELARAEAEAIEAAMRADEERACEETHAADDASHHSDSHVPAPAEERNAYDEDDTLIHAQSPKGHKTLVRQHTWNSNQLAEQLLTGVNAIKVR